jgi:sarcosine oxidase subunit alpha
MIFENNDLPGIFLGRGVQRLMHRDGVRPGRRSVVVTSDDNGYIIARQLMESGVSVAAIADNRRAEEALACDEARNLSDANIPIYTRHRIKSALGHRRVRGSVFTSGKVGHAGPEIKIACDTICVSGNRSPANELIFQRTCQGSYLLESPFQMIRLPDTLKHMEIEDGLYVAGSANGSRGLRQSYLEGKVAGLSAALNLGYGDEATKAERTSAVRSLNKIKSQS